MRKSHVSSASNSARLRAICGYGLLQGRAGLLQPRKMTGKVRHGSCSLKFVLSDPTTSSSAWKVIWASMYLKLLTNRVFFPGQ
eukprot:7470396-Lingulodinium_polyedra.AAC.1